MKTNEMDEGTGSTRSRAAIATLRGLAWLLTTAALLAVFTGLAGPDGPGGKRGFSTMDVNIYIGGGIDRVAALDPADPGYLTNLIATVTGVFYEIVASQPQLRIQRVADEVVLRQPDIVAVAEGTLLRIQSPGDIAFGGSAPATNVVYDYVQMLVEALNARGAHYVVAVTAVEWDAEMPFFNLQTGTLDDIRQTDREVILVRTDLPRGQLRVRNPQSGTFTNVVYFPAIQLSMTRGWCSVDVFARGEVFRYIFTHPEVEDLPQLQVAQARELLSGPANTFLPVILAGDFNSDPLHRDGSLAYDNYTAANFRDAWNVVHPLDPAGGLTWGHDEFLADPSWPFDRRIDQVFFRGRNLNPVRSEVIDLGLNRTEAPLWASDHAALVTEFRIGRLPRVRFGDQSGPN